MNVAGSILRETENLGEEFLKATRKILEYPMENSMEFPILKVYDLLNVALIMITQHKNAPLYLPTFCKESAEKFMSELLLQSVRKVRKKKIFFFIFIIFFFEKI